jgi:hypothetical protein
LSPNKVKLYILIYSLIRRCSSKLSVKVLYTFGNWAYKSSNFCGNVTGKILALSIKKEAARGYKELLICASSVHIMLCESLVNKDLGQRYYFYGISFSLKEVFAKIGITSKPVSAYSLIKVIVLSICTGKSVRVWVPHLSPYTLTNFSRSLLSQLAKRGFVIYFDDGMSAISNRSAIYIEGFLPTNSKVASWNYMFANHEGFPQGIETLSSIEKAILLLKRYPWLGDSDVTGLTQKSRKNTSCCEEYQANAPGKLRKTIVLASRMLDINYVQENIKTYGSINTYYIPHYRKDKNHPELNKLMNIKHSGFLEYSLYLLCKDQPTQVFHGITSTILLLAEFLLRCPYNVDVTFNYVPSNIESDLIKKEEKEDYEKVLQYYKSSILLKNKGVYFS